MKNSSRRIGRTLWVAMRSMLVLTVVLGVGYTLLVTGIGQIALPHQAHGSLVSDAQGRTVGSALIGQSFVDGHGDPLPQYFQSRPSAAGEGYDAAASAGSNLGPENDTLVSAVRERRARIAAFDRVDPGLVPADALTASASGLDPDISPAYAAIQVDRVAAARGLPAATVADLVRRATRPRALGFIGEPRVNVVELNLGLDGPEG